MTMIQEYFDQNESKSRDKIFLDGKKIGELEGNELIIKNFEKLQYIYISELPNLTKLTIKDCEKLNSLEYYLDNQIEINLIGNCSLKNIKTNCSNQKPIIIHQNNSKEGFCWGCVMSAISIIGMVILIVVVAYLLRLINHLKFLIRKKKK